MYCNYKSQKFFKFKKKKKIKITFIARKRVSKMINIPFMSLHKLKSLRNGKTVLYLAYRNNMLTENI